MGNKGRKTDEEIIKSSGLFKEKQELEEDIVRYKRIIDMILDENNY
jgi:hypothetical protein